MMANRFSLFSWVRFRALSLTLSCGLFLTFPGISWGENPKEKRMILNLPEAIRMAIANSPEIGEIQSAIASAQDGDIKTCLDLLQPIAWNAKGDPIYPPAGAMWLTASKDLMRAFSAGPSMPKP